jgi:hypothetical protein
MFALILVKSRGHGLYLTLLALCKIGNRELLTLHLVPHFLDCSRGVTLNWIKHPFLGSSCNISYFNYYGSHCFYSKRNLSFLTRILVFFLVGNPWLCHSSHPERSFKLYCLLGCFLVRLHTTNPITKLCLHSKGPPSRANLGTHVGTSKFFEWGVLMVILSPKDVRFELGDLDFSL